MEVDKIFDAWNEKKKRVESVQRPGFKERDIWYIQMGKNVGFEQDGKGSDFLRPLVVFKKFNNEVFWGVPLTGAHKKGLYYQMIPNVRGRKNSLILSQLRLFDSKRLFHKIGVLDEISYKSLKSRLAEFVTSAGSRIETPRTRRGSARRRL
jgi:mRNA interferase MazF